MRATTLCIFVFCCAVLADAFEVKEVQVGTSPRFLKWNTSRGPVRLVLNSRGSADLSIAAAENALRSAMAAWQNVPGHSMRFEYGGTSATAAANDTDNQNSVLWMEQNWPYSPSVLAITRFSFFLTDPPELADADILINGESVRWSTAPNSSAHPQPVLTHELGHLLGLSHSSVSTSVMFPTYAAGKPKPLTPDERAAIQFLYGAPVQTFRLITPLPGAVYSENMAERGLPEPVFRWGSAGPVQYEIEFSNTPSFQKKVKFTTGTRNSFQPTPDQEKKIQALSPQKVAQWRVISGSQKTPSRAVRFRPPTGPVQSALLKVGVDQEEVLLVRNLILLLACAVVALAVYLFWRHRTRTR